MCARHDIALGRFIVEIDPYEPPSGGSLLLYVRLVDSVDGDELWAGAVRFFGTAVLEADLYGGTPLPFEDEAAGVQSS